MRVEPPPGLFRSSIADLVPYEPGKPIEEVQRELGLDRVVKLASNEGPFPPFPAALEAIERALGEANRYPDGGVYALRRALAERHEVAFEEVLVGAGASAPAAALPTVSDQMTRARQTTGAIHTPSLTPTSRRRRASQWRDRVVPWRAYKSTVY